MRDYLQKWGIFTRDEIEDFISCGKERSLNKDDFFIREGETVKKIAFLKTGIFRSFYHTSSSEEVTYCFTFPNELVTGYSSFITQKETNENIQAIIDCELTEYPKDLLDELIQKHKNWLLFAKQMAERQYVTLEKRIFLLQKESALIRYKELIEKQPEYLQKIPLGYLASYLGVTQRHLSRLRKEYSFGQKS